MNFFYITSGIIFFIKTFIFFTFFFNNLKIGGILLISINITIFAFIFVLNGIPINWLIWMLLIL